MPLLLPPPPPQPILYPSLLDERQRRQIYGTNDVEALERIERELEESFPNPFGTLSSKHQPVVKVAAKVVHPYRSFNTPPSRPPSSLPTSLRDHQCHARRPPLPSDKAACTRFRLARKSKRAQTMPAPGAAPLKTISISEPTTLDLPSQTPAVSSTTSPMHGLSARAAVDPLPSALLRTCQTSVKDSTSRLAARSAIVLCHPLASAVETHMASALPLRQGRPAQPHCPRDNKTSTHNFLQVLGAYVAFAACVLAVWIIHIRTLHSLEHGSPDRHFFIFPL